VNFENLTALYVYLDDLFCQDVSADQLFASSYLRGFISLSASGFGDDSQPLTKELSDIISQKIVDARAELSPADRAIVNNYWFELKAAFK